MGDWTSQNRTKRDGRKTTTRTLTSADFYQLFLLVISQLYVPFSSSFELSNLALDRIVWNKTETDENTSCPMRDWTSQNRTKRDRSWAEFSWAELSWIGLNWAELSWIELDWAEFSWAELSWAELNWAELGWPELSWAETKQDETGHFRQMTEEQQQQQEGELSDV